DHAGKITPQDIGKLHLAVVAGARFPIGCVDAGREDIDHDFAGSRHRIGEIAVLQHFRSAVLIDESRFHLDTSIIMPSPPCGEASLLRLLSAGAIERIGASVEGRYDTSLFGFRVTKSHGGGIGQPSASLARTCAFRKSYPDVVVVQPRQDWDGYNDPVPLHRPT